VSETCDRPRLHPRKAATTKVGPGLQEFVARCKCRRNEFHSTLSNVFELCSPAATTFAERTQRGCWKGKRPIKRQKNHLLSATVRVQHLPARPSFRVVPRACHLANTWENCYPPLCTRQIGKLISVRQFIYTAVLRHKFQALVCRPQHPYSFVWCSSRPWLNWAAASCQTKI
jgi:hypothetical protein